MHFNVNNHTIQSTSNLFCKNDVYYISSSKYTKYFKISTNLLCLSFPEVGGANQKSAPSSALLPGQQMLGFSSQIWGFSAVLSGSPGYCFENYVDSE